MNGIQPLRALQLAKLLELYVFIMTPREKTIFHELAEVFPNENAQGNFPLVNITFEEKLTLVVRTS